MVCHLFFCGMQITKFWCGFPLLPYDWMVGHSWYLSLSNIRMPFLRTNSGLSLKLLGLLTYRTKVWDILSGSRAVIVGIPFLMSLFSTHSHTCSVIVLYIVSSTHSKPTIPPASLHREKQGWHDSKPWRWRLLWQRFEKFMLSYHTLPCIISDVRPLEERGKTKGTLALKEIKK